MVYNCITNYGTVIGVFTGSELTTADFAEGKAFKISCGESETTYKIFRICGRRVSAVYRTSACWTSVSVSDGEVPDETQFLLIENDGGYTAVFAAADGAARTSLYSYGGYLCGRTETYDSSAPIGEVYVAYVISGKDPYRMISLAYEDMEGKIGSFRLKDRSKKPKIDLYFGFCTYNAFQDKVTEDNLLAAAKVFKASGIPLGYIIADDGWHSHEGNYLSALGEDRDKFPHGLKECVSALKRECGLRYFLCWHAFCGYWQGTAKGVLKSCDVVERKYVYPSRFERGAASVGPQNTVTGGFYPDNISGEVTLLPEDTGSFYDEFYSALSSLGADGTKIDAIGWIEAFSEGRGGRAKVFAETVRGIENASVKYFGGELINCSSCTNDFFFSTRGVGVTRVSSDYMPGEPATYPAHVVSSATLGMWTEPVLFCDWDMFRSGDTGGELHAKARAVSGGPIYCSDGLSTFDKKVLKRLVGAGGHVGQCLRNAAPTEDCLFFDLKKDKIYKVFNYTSTGYVLCLFNFGCTDAAARFSLSDVHGIPSGIYAAWSDVRGYLGQFDENTSMEIGLPAFSAEVVTAVPVADGFALIGLKDKYNPSGFVISADGKEANVSEDGEYVAVEDGRVITLVAEENKIVGREND